MKILYHHRTLGDGAEGIHIKEMVNAFRQIGHEVRVIGPVGEPREKSDKDMRITFFSKIRAKLPLFFYELLELSYNFYGFFLLAKEISRDRPDFIYDRYMVFNASSILVGKKYGIPVFLEVNAPLALERYQQPDEKLYLKSLAFFLEKWICSNSFRTIVVSTPLKEYLVSNGVPAEKIVVMPNGVNPEIFKPSEEKSKELLEKCGFCEDDIIVGFVGILRPWHGIDLLLDAFNQAAMRIKNLKLLIVGDGPIRFHIEQKIRVYSINDKVHITGKVRHTDVPCYANLFDIAVSPRTTFYASPMKILEYMALGKAVVAPDTGNVRDIITEGTGVLFSVDSCNSLTESLLLLASSEELRKDLGKRARKRILEESSWTKNAKYVLGNVEESNANFFKKKKSSERRKQTP